MNYYLFVTYILLALPWIAWGQSRLADRGDCVYLVSDYGAKGDGNDDAFCLKRSGENIHISGSLICGRQAASFKIGTETDGVFRNISMTNSSECVIRDNYHYEDPCGYMAINSHHDTFLRNPYCSAV